MPVRVEGHRLFGSGSTVDDQEASPAEVDGRRHADIDQEETKWSALIRKLNLKVE